MVRRHASTSRTASTQSIERFKLVVATEKVDDFLLAQPALTLGDEYRRDEGDRKRPAVAQGRVHDERMVHQGLPGPRGAATRVTWRHRATRSAGAALRPAPRLHRRHRCLREGVAAEDRGQRRARAGAGAGREAALRRASAGARRARRRAAHAARETMARLVTADDRVLFYFAGHGIAADGDDGPAGYLVPADADPTRPEDPHPDGRAAGRAAGVAVPPPAADPRLLLLRRLPVGQPDAGHRHADAQAHLQGTVRPVRPRSRVAGHHLGRLRPEGDGRPAGPRHRRPRAGRDRQPARRIRRSRWRCSTRSPATPTSAPGAKATA